MKYLPILIEHLGRLSTRREVVFSPSRPEYYQLISTFRLFLFVYKCNGQLEIYDKSVPKHDRTLPVKTKRLVIRAPPQTKLKDSAEPPILS
jgi:hypothetical protein